MLSVDIGTKALHKQVVGLAASVSSLSESVARCAAVQQVTTCRLKEIEGVLTERTEVPPWQPVNHAEGAQIIEMNDRLAKLESFCVSLHRHDISEDSQDNRVPHLTLNTVSERVVAIESRLTALENHPPQLSSVGLSLKKLDKDVADLRDTVQSKLDIETFTGEQTVSKVILPAESSFQDGSDLVFSTNQQPPEGKSNCAPPKSFSAGATIPTVIRGTGFLCSADEYQLETSIYGVIALPASPLRFGACFLVLVLYTLTAGLLYIIRDSVIEDMGEVRNELYVSSDGTRSLCRQVFLGDDYIWDCSPDSLVDLMNFGVLDLDGDGTWSAAEAMQSKLLPFFRSLMEVTLEHDEVLARIFPPIEPALDPFCTMALRVRGENSNVVNYLSASEQLAMFQTSGRVTPDMLYQCGIPSELGRTMSDQSLTRDRNATTDRNTTTFPLAFTRFSCLLDALCGEVPLTPGKSSAIQFYEATSYMSYISRALHTNLSGMLRPCRILDPELCANAEVQEHTLLEDLWPNLHIDQAIKECSRWVSEVCPKILGEEFAAFQARMGVACGERRYNVVRRSEVGRVSMRGTGRDSGVAYLDCQDASDDGKHLLKLGTQMMYERRPFYRYLAWAEEAAFGLPRGTIENNLDCTLANILFRNQNFLVVHPLTNRSMTVSDLTASICPMTVCQRSPMQVMHMGCPAHCLRIADETHHAIDPFRKNLVMGEYSQVGLCSGFHTEIDAISGALKISRLMSILDGVVEHCEIVLRLNKSVRVYVTFWNLPMREEIAATSGFCIGDYLMIGGVKYCTTQSPAPVTLEPTFDGYASMLWTTCRTCGPFNYDSEGYRKWSPTGFELLITETDVPTEHTLVVVDFEMHSWYWKTTNNGVTSALFRIFLFLIMLVWIGYLGEEWYKSMRYTKFIMQEYRQVPARRVGLIIFLVIPRISVWVIVLHTGILLVATANSYIDLVLNSVALAFVLDFDEYLFVIAVPVSVQEELIGRGTVKLETLGIESWYHKNIFRFRAKDKDTSTMMRMTGFFVFAIIVVFGLYKTDWLGSPHFDKVADIYDCICALRGNHCPAF